jgi:hypothetical protein
VSVSAAAMHDLGDSHQVIYQPVGACRRLADCRLDPEALAVAVERITASADGLTVVLPPEEGEATAVEGRIVFREHRARERYPRVVRAKKDVVLIRP